MDRRRLNPLIEGPPDGGDGMAPILERNIRALAERRLDQVRDAGLSERIAEFVTAFAGSMLFVAVHLVIVACWIAVNLGLVPGVPVFDASFVILATAASVEAIFLSTFVLISQNRAAADADRRADLDLQVNLLAEHEITRLITLTRAIAEHLGIDEAQDPALEELEDHIAPERVLDELEAQKDEEAQAVR